MCVFTIRLANVAQYLIWTAAHINAQQWISSPKGLNVRFSDD